MTKEELRARSGMAEMLASDNFGVLLAFFAEGCPFVGDNVSADKVNNEGKLQGWLQCLAYMRAVRKSDPPREHPKKEGGLYQEPHLQSDKNKP